MKDSYIIVNDTIKLFNITNIRFKSSKNTSIVYIDFLDNLILKVEEIKKISLVVDSLIYTYKYKLNNTYFEYSSDANFNHIKIINKA